MKKLASTLLRRFMPSSLFMWLRFWSRHGYCANVFRPERFSEKILAKMFFDRSPFLEMTADKLHARAFIAQTVGDQFLPKVFAVWHSAGEVELDPRWGPVVMKASHGSGFVKIIADPVRADLAEIRALSDAWLRINYGRREHEWCYLSAKPAVYIEAMIGDGNPDALVDYKLFCFSGVPKFMKVIQGMQGVTRSFYADMDWQNLKVADGQLPLPIKDSIKPGNFDVMIDLARQLSQGSDMVRVDMYNIDGQIYIGELTNYPQAGAIKLSPPQREDELGRFWPRQSMSYLPFSKLFRKV